MIKKFNLNSLHNYSHFLYLLNFLLALNFTRFPDILELSYLRFVQFFILFLGFVFGFFSVFLYYKKIALILLTFIAAIFLHAWANFFQPSLRLNISVQDYILQENVSAKFLFTQTRLYLMYFVCLFFPALSFLLSLYKNKLKSYIFILFIVVFLLSALSNSVVSILQRIYDLHFLSAGSGTSVEAGRTSGLVEDSGIASFVFAMFLCISGFSSYYFNGSKRILFAVFTAIVFLGGVCNNSRAFYIGVISFLLTFLLFVFIKNLKYKNYKSTILIASSVTVVVGASVFFLNYYNSHSAVLRILAELKSFSFDKSLIENYGSLDPVRAANLQVMIYSIKNNFFVGTGLGSYLQDYYQYLPLLSFIHMPDLPCHLSLAILSELGIAGLIMLIGVILTFFYYLKKTSNEFSGQRNLNNYKDFLTKCIPLGSALFLFLISFVGYHISFVNGAFFYSYFIAFIIAFALINKSNFEKLFFRSALLASFFLLASTVYLAWKAPVVPAFRLVERGQFQVPKMVGTLPQLTKPTEKNKTRFSEIMNRLTDLNSKLFVPFGAEEGIWMQKKTEVLLFKRFPRIFIGPQIRDFPVDLNFTFYNAGGISEHRSLVVQKAGWVELPTPQDTHFSSCYDGITKESFCYFYIHVHPAWDLSFTNSVGFFIENKYLIPNII